MEDLAKEELEQLYPVFRDQSLEILDAMSDDLFAVEAGALDMQIVARLRRGAHTIKGDAACIGLERLGEVAHRIEDYLEHLGNDPSRLDKQVAGRLIGLVDMIRSAVLNDFPTDLHEFPTDFLLAEACEHDAVGGVKKESKQRRSVLRVDAAKVDDLLNLAGEMMIARSGLEQASREINICSQEEGVVSRMRRSVEKLGGLIDGFQKTALKMRMVPVDTLFRRYSRAMRDMAGELGKEVDLEYSGEKTELDRTLVEMLYEPILHLLRNAIDHGIEPVDERVRAGKRRTGLVRMRAFHEADEVVLELSDDGRGIDIDALKLKACESGLLRGSIAQEMSDDDSARLVFADGVSTAKAITRLSGRGIGGASVKSVVEQMRGRISVRTEQGKGTTFTLRVPLTLAMLRSLLFTAGRNLVALPMADIREVAQIDENAVVHIGGIECYRVQGCLLPLVRLHPEGNSKSDGEVCRYLIVVKAGREFAIATETIYGVEELVVKPLESRWIRGNPCVGAAVLGNGQVVLIQDARALYDRTVNKNHYRENYELEPAR